MFYNVPKGVDIDTLLRKNPFVLPNGRKVDNESLLYILHLINTKSICNSRFIEEDGAVPLNANKLSRLIYKYNHYIDYLVKSNVITTNYQYITLKNASVRKAASARKYKFCREINLTPQLHEVKDQKLKKAIKKAKNLSHYDEIKHSQLLKWFDNDLSIDSEGALKYINSWFSDEMEQVKTEKEQEILYTKYRVMLNSEIHFRNKDWTFSVDDFGRRFYSNITGLNKKLRKYITYRKKPLVSVDMSNCQPFLILGLADCKFWTNTNQSFPINKLGIKRVINSLLISNKKQANIPMLDKIAEIQYSQGFERYKKLVENGEIYKYFYERTYFMDDPFSDEYYYIDTDKFGEIKTEFISTINASEKRPSILKPIMEDDFSEINELFSIIKSKDHIHMSKLLQTMERHLIIDIITKRVSKENKTIPIYTIHDNIVTTLGNENYLKEIMHEEINKAINATPTFKIEYWME
ncbi:MAG: hypothetical protein JNK27_01350 [Chitinophagaceae bacterium]|nr:hypothetical protein [Chitinophagaceae bacterium]